MDKWKPGNVYLRITPVGEKPFVTRSQCWNTEIFIDTQRKSYADQGGIVEVITETQFNKERSRS